MFFCKNKFRHCGYHNLSCHWPHKFCEQHLTRPSRGAKSWSMASETDLRFGEDRWSELHRFTGGKNMFWCQKFWRQISPWPADWKPLDFLAPLDTSRGDERCCSHNLHGQWRPRLWLPQRVCQLGLIQYFIPMRHADNIILITFII